MMLIRELRQDRKVATVVVFSRCLGHLAITVSFETPGQLGVQRVIPIIGTEISTCSVL